MNLFISEIQLISQKERKARQVFFHRERTLIQGKNHTGKSSLVKSIYQTFGAETSLHPKFQKASVATLVKFELDGTRYQIVRDSNKFGIFDESGRLLKKFTSVSKELTPFLSELFDFKPIFQQNNNEFSTPPPAFLFLPFYIDQDESWTKSWQSFNRLTQYKSHRNQSIYYHSGIRPNKYYSTKKEIERYIQEISMLDNERKVTNTILSQIREKLGAPDFSLDVEAFKDEIAELLVESDKLKKKEEQLKHKLLDLYNIKAIITAQIEITKRAIAENRSDLKFASDELPQQIECPTCGAHYDNSFSERFAIAADERKSKDLLIELTKELNDVSAEIKSENDSLVKTSSEVERIELLLNQKKGDIVFKDVIDSNGKQQVRILFSERIQALTADITQNTIKKSSLEKELKALENRKKKADILSTFQDYLSKFLREIDIKSLSIEDYKDITAKIEAKETGSSRPRALVAYYFAFFYLMKDYSGTTYCPIIIDSPNQQDQDMEHIDKILGFINNNQPKGSQMILSLAETYGVDFNCEIITLSDKYNLLSDTHFELVSNHMTPLLDAMWF